MSGAGRIVLAVALCVGPLTRTSIAQNQDHAERKTITRIVPIYPDLAKRTHLSGVVKLEVVVRPNGSVKSIRVLGGNPVLVESATEAVRKWRFETAPEETTEALQLTFGPH